MKRAKRCNAPLSAILCDIDFFKRYNDSYGHQAGDDCLKTVASAMKQNARRAGDCVARYGGEEFMIVLPNTKLDAALYVANTIRQAVCDLQIPHSASQTESFVTISLGVSCTENVENPPDLVSIADRYLYLAKEKGRNRVEPCKNAEEHSSPQVPYQQNAPNLS